MHPIIKNFIFTRTIFISLVLFLYNSILKRYDDSNSLLTVIILFNCQPRQNSSIFEYYLSLFLQNFYSYDSVHFVHIAENGYTTIKNFAFLPIWPYLIRYTAYMIKPMINLFIFPFTNDKLYFILSGFLLSNLICLFNGSLIYS